LAGNGEKRASAMEAKAAFDVGGRLRNSDQMRSL